MSPGSSVKLGVIRDGNTQTISVTLSQMQNQQQAQAGSDEQDSSQSPRLGLSLAPARTTGAANQGVGQILLLDKRDHRGRNFLQRAGDFFRPSSVAAQ